MDTLKAFENNEFSELDQALTKACAEAHSIRERHSVIGSIGGCLTQLMAGRGTDTLFFDTVSGEEGARAYARIELMSEAAFRNAEQEYLKKLKGEIKCTK